MGEPKSGKTSFINTFVNYIEGITFKKKKRAKVIKAEEGKIRIYEFKLKNNNTGIRIIKTPGLELDKKDEKIYGELENVLRKYSYINAICIICQGYFVRLDDEKKFIIFSNY